MKSTSKLGGLGMEGGVYYQLQMGSDGVPLILDEALENHLRVEFTRCVEQLHPGAMECGLSRQY